MGNHPVPFKRLSEEISPPLKAGYNDSYSALVEMESLPEVHDDNKWDKAYAQCGTRSKRLTCGRFKPQINVVFCCLIVIIVAVIIALLMYKCAYTKIMIFQTKISRMMYPASITLKTMTLSWTKSQHSNIIFLSLVVSLMPSVEVYKWIHLPLKGMHLSPID